MNKSKTKGQGLVEYVAITALVAIVSIAAMKVFGGKVHRRLNQISTTFDRNIDRGLKAKSVINDDQDELSDSGVSNGGSIFEKLKIPGIGGRN